MRKRMLKKSEVLREGYMKGLRKAQKIINEALIQSQGFDNDISEMGDSDSVTSGGFSAAKTDKKSRSRLSKKLIRICDKSYDEADDEILERLVKMGANVNCTDIWGNTPLHYCAYNGKETYVYFLLDNGANPNIENDAGLTPLNLAQEADEDVIINALRKHGAKG